MAGTEWRRLQLVAVHAKALDHHSLDDWHRAQVRRRERLLVRQALKERLLVRPSASVVSALVLLLVESPFFFPGCLKFNFHQRLLEKS